jgi:Protein of unknown function (DUF1353)
MAFRIRIDRHILCRFLLVPMMALASCGTYDRSESNVGRFSGSVYLLWIGEGGGSGDGKFVFFPAPGNELTFTRLDAQGKKLPTRAVIVPEMMYTDGGSIPRLAQVFNGFNPWGYAPAYMIHDWIFIAHHCNRLGTASPAEMAMDGMTFEESAYVLGDAIETLVAQKKVSRKDVAENAIPSAVAGPVSRELWRNGSCVRVSPEDRAEAEKALTARARSLAPDSIPSRARVVAEVSF